MILPSKYKRNCFIFFFICFMVLVTVLALFFVSIISNNYIGISVQV